MSKAKISESSLLHFFYMRTAVDKADGKYTDRDLRQIPKRHSVENRKPVSDSLEVDLDNIHQYLLGYFGGCYVVGQDLIEGPDRISATTWLVDKYNNFIGTIVVHDENSKRLQSVDIHFCASDYAKAVSIKPFACFEIDDEDPTAYHQNHPYV